MEYWYDEEPHGECSACGYEGTHWHRAGDFKDGDPNDDTRVCSNCGASEVTPETSAPNHIPQSWQPDPLEEQFRTPSSLQWNDPRNSKIGSLSPNRPGIVDERGGRDDVLEDARTLVHNPDEFFGARREVFERGDFTAHHPQHMETDDAAFGPRLGKPKLDPGTAAESNDLAVSEDVRDLHLAQDLIDWEKVEANGADHSRDIDWHDYPVRAPEQPAEGLRGPLLDQMNGWVSLPDRSLDNGGDGLVHSPLDNRQASRVPDWIVIKPLNQHSGLRKSDYKHADPSDPEQQGRPGRGVEAGLPNQSNPQGHTTNHRREGLEHLAGEIPHVGRTQPKARIGESADVPTNGGLGPAVRADWSEVKQLEQPGRGDRNRTRMAAVAQLDEPAQPLPLLSQRQQRNFAPVVGSQGGELLSGVTGDLPTRGDSHLESPHPSPDLGQGQADDRKRNGNDLTHVHGGILSVNDPPSPVNQSALSVNPVGSERAIPWPEGPPPGGQPFVFDQGTNTVHLAPLGYRHAMIYPLVNNWQGPVYKAELDPDTHTVTWHDPPRGSERQTVVDKLSEHTGLPLTDEWAWDPEDKFKLGKTVSRLASKFRRRKPGRADEHPPVLNRDPELKHTLVPGRHQSKLVRSRNSHQLTCATCGDPLDTPDCPRCNWGGWSTAEDNTKNPSGEAVIDMSRGIQAKRGRGCVRAQIPVSSSGSRPEGDPTRSPRPGRESSMDPSCPKCGSPMYWRDAAGLTGLHPEGAWECSNTHCWNMVTPGNLAPDIIPQDPDTGHSDLTFPEHWSNWAEEPFWTRERLPWDYGAPGKGWLGENGVHTWRIDPTGMAAHRNERNYAQQTLGSLLYPFHIDPSGYVYTIGRPPVSPEHMQQIQAFDPRLHQNAPDNDFTLSMVKKADYQGWTNWHTWNTKLMMDNDYDLYQQREQMLDKGWTPEQIRDWALQHVIGPHNKQAIEDAREWNEIPEHDRLDHHFEDLKDKSPEAADLVNNLGFGPDVSDDEPTLIDPELVNWHEIHRSLNDEHHENQRYEQEHQRLQGTGLGWTTPGHDDEIQQMRDAMYRFHGAVPEEDLQAELGPGYHGDDPRNYFRRKVNVPLEQFKQWSGWPEHFLPGGPDTARSKLFDYRFNQAEEKARAELLKQNPNLTPEQLDKLLHSRGAFRPDYIQPHFPGGKYDTPFNLEDPTERQILESHPDYQGWAQNGYPMSLSDYTWDAISAIRKGQPHPYTTQMQQALQQRGYTPEQIAQIMSQPPPPAPRQPDSDPSLDQPGELTFPSEWEGSGGPGTFSRVIPQDRWWMAS